MYVKLSVDTFKDLLAGDKYANATAARRAVGKASQLAEEEKNVCRQLIDQHFGDAPVKKTRSTAKAEPRPAAKKVQARTSSVRAVQPAEVSGPKARRGEQLELFDAFGTRDALDDFSSLTTQMRIAEMTIQNTGSALGTLIEAKKICPDADLAPNIEAASAVITGAVEIFRAVTHQVTSYMAHNAREQAQKEVVLPSKSNGRVGQSIVEDTMPLG